MHIAVEFLLAGVLFAISVAKDCKMHLHWDRIRILPPEQGVVGADALTGWRQREELGKPVKAMGLIKKPGSQRPSIQSAGAFPDEKQTIHPSWHSASNA